MSFFDAILLGIVQGLTEFLPISSTAHLTLTGKLLGLVDEHHPEQWTAFIAVLQLGTLLAVLAYFGNEILSIIRSSFREIILERKSFAASSSDTQKGIHIVVGTIPIVVVGLLFKKIIEGALTKNLWLIAANLIFFALVLFFAEKISKRERTAQHILWRDTLAIGCAQVFALFPGASRSGVTIAGGLFSGLTREAAAEYSFLLSVPAVCASGLLELQQSFLYTHSLLGAELFVGTVASAVVGYASIKFLLKFLKTHSNNIFIFYRIAVGMILLALLYYSFIHA
ncbi:MAG: undecaprenyl-diphosphatase UppP [Ignavibacteria bacterium]|nr:undecaprenyl-diphosphatase UppP [Ignavibacteria bacterium]